METTVRDIEHLRAEIARLKSLEALQGVALKARFASPAAIFSTAMSIFPGASSTLDGVKNAGFFKQDFLGLLSRFLLPLTLNKTLFRKSNFIVKTIVGILSQKASGYINEESVTGVWDKAKGFFNNLFKKKEQPVKVEIEVVAVPQPIIPQV